ncbi:MAG TPA: DnaD domain protein [Gemmatimonadaceae bacterium]
MPWVRLDDHFDQNPKIAQVGPLGLALWVTGLAYCNRNLTDGFIPWSVARTMVSWDWLDITEPKNAERGYQIASASRTCGMRGDDIDSDYVIALLVVAGLWDEVDGGFQIHDYGDFQPTKAQVEAERAAKQAAGQAGGQASAQARAKQRLEQNSTTTQAKSKPDPVPDPVPDPNPQTDPAAAATARALRAYEDCAGSLTQSVSERITSEIAEGTSIEWIVAACEEAALSNGRNWKYIERILDRWKREGFKSGRNHAAPTRSGKSGGSAQTHPTPAGRSGPVRRGEPRF